MSTHAHEIDGAGDSTDPCEPHESGKANASLVAAIPSEPALSALAGMFDALSDPTRLRILLALANAGALCVCDLAEVAGVSSSAVSHQLRMLRDRNLVTFSRAGKRAMYRLADAHVVSLLEQGLDHAHESAGGRG